MAISKGFRVGSYEVLAPLSSGGMGDVYIALDLKLNRQVALKILQPHAQSDARCIQRFVVEAQAASALNHPNIVTIHDAGEAEIGHFIVMELVHGKTLRSLIGLTPNLRDFVHIGGQIAEGLSVAHAAQIIHRDIKPENLMVRDDRYVKILDFGLARLNVDSLIYPEKTADGLTSETILGSLRYMSPEQAQGQRLTSATDVFSLGIVLYEFATGNHPFESGNNLSVINAIINQEPLPPTALNPGLPQAFDSLILRMLQKNVQLRPTAAQVKEILSEPESGEATLVLSSGRQKTFVGRTKERTQLHAKLDDALEGRGSIVCVEGEAGLGKTTLVEHFLREASRRCNCLTGRGRSSERLAGSEAYLPMLEIIESLIHGPDGASVGHLLKLLAPTWYLHVVSTTDMTAIQALSQTQAISQDRMRREFSTFLLAIAQTRPIILFLDDVHWSDISTIDLLVHIGSKLGASQVLVILAYRPAEMQLTQHPFLRVQRDLQTRGVCQTIILDFLSKQDLENYLDLEFSHPKFSPDFLTMLHTKTEGNALFLVDVLRYLKERRLIAEVNQRWVLLNAVPDIDRQLPESVRGMIQKNIDMLGEKGRRLLVAASVEGYEFHASIVAKVLKMDTADVEEELDQLDRLHGFIRVCQEEELPNGTITLRYRFVHVLYQAALHGSLKPARRAALSRAVARELENGYNNRSNEIASELAVLFESAREFDRAGEYFYTAAVDARDVLAFEEAVLLVRRGLAAIQSIEETPRLLRTKALLHMTLGVALVPIKGFGNDEVRATLDTAYALRQWIEPGRELMAVLTGLFEYHIARLQIPTARQLAEQLMEQGLQIGIPAFVVRGRTALGVSMFFAGRFQETTEILDQALQEFEAVDYRTKFRSFDIDIEVICLSLSARALTLLGYPDQGHAKMTEAVQLALSLPDPYSQCWAYQMSIGSLAQTQFDRSEQEQAIEDFITTATENGLSYWKAHGVGHKGWLLCQQGKYNEGISLLRQGQEGVRLSGTRPSMLYFTGLLAEALLQNGNAGEGLQILESEMFDTERLGMSFAELARIRARLLSVLARPADAENWFKRSISAARAQNARLYELRTLTAWLHCCSGRSLREHLRDEIIALLASFTEGWTSIDVVRAKEALSTTSG